MAAEAAPSYRPFSCPNCKRLIELRPYAPRYAVAGCLGMCVVCSLGFVAIGLGLVGIAAGAVAGFLITRLAVGWIKQRWPHPPELKSYDVRTYPENLIALAELLDQAAAASEWNTDWDKRIETAQRNKTYDDELENVSIDLAEIHKAKLQGSRPPKRKRVPHDMGLDELRKELRAVAGDLRIAAK